MQAHHIFIVTPGQFHIELKFTIEGEDSAGAAGLMWLKRCSIFRGECGGNLTGIMGVQYQTKIVQA
ncbi:MAG: hypothetical protein GDYSWBUE_000246 [Candidatus Fervidibacterota bacterium]